MKVTLILEERDAAALLELLMERIDELRVSLNLVSRALEEANEENERLKTGKRGPDRPRKVQK